MFINIKWENIQLRDFKMFGSCDWRSVAAIAFDSRDWVR